MANREIIAVYFVFLAMLNSHAGTFMHDSTDIKKTTLPVEGNSASTSENRTFNQLQIPTSETNFDPIVIPEQFFSDSTQYYRSKALEYEQEVMSRGALIGNLNDVALLKLPVGLEKQVGNISYTIIISRFRATPQGSFIEAYFMFELPQTGDKIAFRGIDIPVSNNGGFSGTGRLELIGSYPIKINEKTLFTIVGATSSAPSNSFVEFDCNGFRQMGIEGEVEFSRDLIIPEDENGKQRPAPERVKTRIVTVVQSWNDLLLGVTIPSFQVNGLNDVSFSVKNAFLDWSDLANPSGMMFPSGYVSPFIQSGHHAMWHGFYLERLEVRLPKFFTKNRGDNTRITLGVERVILDDQGFTGNVFAENVLAAGDMNGWGYSINRVGLELVINQVKGFEVAGEIAIPKIVSKTDDKAANFGYRAQRGADGNYIFAVSLGDKLKLPVFVADITLYPGSSITVRERENKFYPTANLNGDFTIKNVKASFNQIRFEGMRISSEEPRFDIQRVAFGNSGEQSVSKFPVVISAISVKRESKKIGIGFNLTINIGGKSSDEGFGGTAALTVWGKNEPKNILGAEGQVIGTEDEWKFDNVELSGVGINIKKPGAYELTGKILFFEGDPVYGNGFSGTLNGKMSSFGGIQATALFGRTETFRYWYADAMVTLEAPGVPLVPGALFATGFGGGFYSKMKQTDKSPGSGLGQTKSGIYYIPDENTLGIKAIMNIGTARPEAMNGDVGLEVVMNRHGGINSITLTGNANFMSLQKLAENKMKELASSAAAGKLAEKLAGLLKGQVYGSMKLQFDNVNDVFHGNLDIYINVAGGLVRGIGQNNRAGWAVLHFERTDWYVLIGTPDDPLGLEVARIFKSKSYFMLGKNLPGSPPPPSQVTEILGNVDMDYMRDMNALQSGTGFAFGLHFIVDTGDLKFLMFYGRFAAGTGVDFMLKDYGAKYHCEGSSGPFGINGWYANGQAYAFVMGKIGIKVNLKFYKGSYDILSMGAAAVLQTKGPNPFWMKGTVGGYYRILGGLVKGNCKFEVTVGKDCKPVGEQNLLEDIKIIAQVTPANGSDQVDVFNTPQIAFNIPIGEVFTINDMEGKSHSFRAVLDQFNLFDGSKKIEGELQWNNNDDVVIFDGRDLLPGERKIKLIAKLTFEERIRNVWTKVKFDGKIVEEKAEVAFQTGKAPDHIPANNVALAYPLKGQVNFYPKEHNQGFIQLKDGQPYLFNPGREWIQKIRMTEPASQRYVESDLTYNASQKKVAFTIPSGFENGKVYMFEILNIPRQASVIDANVSQVQKELIADTDGGSATLTTKKIEGQLGRLEVKSIFNSTFRTSKYNTFVEKMNAIKVDLSYRVDLDLNVFRLASYLNGDEVFDAAELDGIMGAERLVRMEAVLAGNSWYENYTYPVVYEGYPLLNWIKVTRRDPNILGVPPAKDVFLANIRHRQVIEENSPAFTPISFSDEYIAYNLAESVDLDYHDFQHQAVNYLMNHVSEVTPRLSNLIMKPAPHIRYGNYKVKVSYVIPGTNTVSSSYEWVMHNSVPDN